MTITTDQAIALAREVGFNQPWTANPQISQKLTTLCNKVERDTLLEAADELDKVTKKWGDDDYEYGKYLRQMAGVECCTYHKEENNE